MALIQAARKIQAERKAEREASIRLIFAPKPGEFKAFQEQKSSSTPMAMRVLKALRRKAIPS